MLLVCVYCTDPEKNRNFLVLLTTATQPLPAVGELLLAFTTRKLVLWDPMLSSDCDTRLCSGYVMNVSHDLGSVSTETVGGCGGAIKFFDLRNGF